MAEIKCVSSFFEFETTESTLDCFCNEQLIDACIEAETTERCYQKSQETLFDSAFDTALYQAVEDFENTLQVGRGIKRLAENIIQNEQKRKLVEEAPSTSSNLQPSTQPSKSNNLQSSTQPSSEEDLAECDVCNVKVKKRYTMVIKTFVFFDLESTGLPREQRNRTKITELCFVATTRYDILDTKYGVLPAYRSLSLLFNPERSVHPVAARMTGLTREYLKNYPTFDKHVDKILDFLEDLQKPVCLVAHNGNVFDYKLLKTEFVNAKRCLPTDLLCVDSLQGFRRILKDNPIDYRSFHSIMLDDILTDDEDDFPELNISKEDWSEIDKLSESFSDVSIDSSSSMSNKSINQSGESLETNSLDSSNSINKSDVAVSPNTSNESSKKGQLILSTLYKRLMNKEPANAHRAEADCLMLMECVGALKGEFLPWADVCCKRIESVKPFVPF